MLGISTRYPVEPDSSGLLVIIVVLEFFSYAFLVKLDLVGLFQLNGSCKIAAKFLSQKS